MAVPQTILLASSAAMGAGFNTPAVNSYDYDRGGISVNWSGADSTNGSVTIQDSPDGQNWGNVQSSVTTLSTASGSFNFPIIGTPPLPFLRAVYNAGTNTVGAINIAFTGLRTRHET